MSANLADTIQFTPEDFAYLAAMLRHDAASNRPEGVAMTLAHNLDVVLAALDLASQKPKQ